ncbi:MAG: hypothetical protein ACRYG5_17000 [Janthinobacterium lividum]
MNGDMLEGVLEFAVEILALASVVLIWAPAFKISSALRDARDLAELALKTSSKDLAEVAAGAAEEAGRAPVEFSKRDDSRLRWGLLAAGAASAIKILVLIPAAHRWITL